LRQKVYGIASVEITDHRHPNQGKPTFSGAGLPSSCAKLKGYEVLASRRWNRCGCDQSGLWPQQTHPLCRHFWL